MKTLRLLATLGALVAPAVAVAQTASVPPADPTQSSPQTPAPDPVFGPSPDGICSWGC